MHTSQLPSHQQIVPQEVPTYGEPQAVALSRPQRMTHARGSREETTGKWAVLVLVGIGIFIATLDTSIVNISLPTLAQSFGVPLGGAVEWVVIAYLVAATACLFTAGRLADLFGRTIVWTTGLALFTASSALCALAPSLDMLIAARTLQGIGPGMWMRRTSKSMESGPTSIEPLTQMAVWLIRD